MRILVLTSCTGSKATWAENQLTLADFRSSSQHLEERERELQALALPAGRLYTGDQHVRLMRGVAAARQAGHAVTVSILSAGYGFIDEDRVIPPYECTFAKMRRKELREWADRLTTPSEFRKRLSQPFDLGLVLLGDKYLEACAPGPDLQLGGPTTLFCGRVAARSIPSIPQLEVVTLNNAEARREKCGLIGLKGEMAARILRELPSYQIGESSHSLRTRLSPL